MIPGRWVSIAFTLWVAVITFRYGSTVVGSLRSPFNLGSDLEWFAIWLAAALLMILLAATIKRAVQIVFAILAAAGALILILSGTLVSAIIVLGLLWLAHTWAKRISVLLGVQSGLVAIEIP